jgi:hypothetical protein
MEEEVKEELEEPDKEVEKAAEIFDGDRKLLITLFKDKSISLCTKKPDGFECYEIGAKEDNTKLYYGIQAWFSSLKFKVKDLT